MHVVARRLKQASEEVKLQERKLLMPSRHRLDFDLRLNTCEVRRCFFTIHTTAMMDILCSMKRSEIRFCCTNCRQMRVPTRGKEGSRSAHQEDRGFGERIDRRAQSVTILCPALACLALQEHLP